jgi:hypothetical protein
LYSEVFSEISTLIDVRYKHQSKEEAKAVRVAHGSQRHRANNICIDEQEGTININQQSTEELHNPSQRELAKKINEVIKASLLQEVGVTTGLSRRTRWVTADNLAPGSSVPTSGGANTTGNVANAQAAARKAAQAVSQSVALSNLMINLITVFPTLTDCKTARTCIRTTQECRDSGIGQSQ